jgi:hypothetical protein
MGRRRNIKVARTFAGHQDPEYPIETVGPTGRQSVYNTRPTAEAIQHMTKSLSKSPATTYHCLTRPLLIKDQGFLASLLSKSTHNQLGSNLHDLLKREEKTDKFSSKGRRVVLRPISSSLHTGPPVLKFAQAVLPAKLVHYLHGSDRSYSR